MMELMEKLVIIFNTIGKSKPYRNSSMLKKKFLGKTTFEVTEIGFGGWGIGSFHYGDVSEKDGRACIETYLQYGGNFIDTARLYNNSDKIIGHVLQKHGNRERVFVASKSPTPVFETFLDIHKNELFIA